MNELEQLKKENKALLNAINRLGGTIEKLLDINNHFKSDKQKHIADIKADAVMSAANNWKIGVDYDYTVRAELIKISNKLRDES